MEEKKGVGWILPAKVYKDLKELSDHENRSVTSMATIILQKGIEDAKVKRESISFERTIAEGKVVDTIDSCLTLEHLNSALTMINLFIIAFGESEMIYNAYENKKSLIN